MAPCSKDLAIVISFCAMKREELWFNRSVRAVSSLLLVGLAATVPASAFAQYAQPGYPPPAAYPPPGYAPPPDYQPPSTGYYQPAYSSPPPSEPAFRRGFLAMPFLGLHVPVGRSSDSLDVGMRLGTLLGGHVAPFLSLNGEFTIDILNPKNVASGYDVTEVVVDLAFSPLFHISNGGLELVMGPKLGAFGVSASTKNPSGASGGANGQGLSYGGNLGIFGAVGNLAVGGLVGFTGRRLTKACVTPPGATETCDTSPGGYDLKVFSITGAVLF